MPRRAPKRKAAQPPSEGGAEKEAGDKPLDSSVLPTGTPTLDDAAKDKVTKRARRASQPSNGDDGDGDASAKGPRAAFGRSASMAHSGRKHRVPKRVAEALMEAHLRKDAGLVRSDYWELAFGTDEYLAIKGNTGDFWVGRLREDVLAGYAQDYEVEVCWFDVSADNPDRYYSLDDFGTISIGTIICAMTDVVKDVPDAEAVLVTEAARARVAESLARQVGDDYSSGNEMSTAASQYRTRIKKMPGLRRRAGHGSAKAKGGGDDDDESDGDGDGSHARKKRRKGSAKAAAKKPSKGHRLAPRPEVALVPDPFTVKAPKANTFLGDTERASKEVIRAVVTKDAKLLRALIAEPTAILSLEVPRSVHVPKSALEHALELGHQDAAALLLTQLYKPDRPDCGAACEITLETLTSGRHTSSYASYNRRRVTASRGGREGNNAFTKNMVSGAWPTDTGLADNSGMCAALFHPGVGDGSVALLELIEKRQPQVHAWLANVLHQVVRAGNHRLAHHVLAAKVDECGLNKFHVSALSDGFEEGVKIPKVSVLKKSAGYAPVRFCPTHCAAINPDARHLDRLLKIDQAAVSCPDSTTASLLHYAAVCSGVAPLVLLLKEYRCFRNPTMEKTGETPLLWAVRAGRHLCVRLLLCDEELSAEHGFEANLAGKEDVPAMLTVRHDHRSLLHHAVAVVDAAACLKTVAALLAAGADPNARAEAEEDKVTPVHIACRLGKLPVLQLLCEHGGDLNLDDKRDVTAPMMAAMNGHAHVLSFLLQQGCDPDSCDSSGNTATHYAVAYGWSACLELLMALNAQLDAKNQWNTTPVSLALQLGRIACTSLLLERGKVDVNFQDKEGCTLLQVVLKAFVARLDAAGKDGPGHLQMPWALTTILGDKSLKIDLPDAKGNTPLHIVAGQAYTTAAGKALAGDLFRLLVEAGCDQDARNEDGEPPVLTAFASGNADIALSLLQGGANPEHCVAKASGLNILHFVARLMSLPDTAVALPAAGAAAAANTGGGSGGNNDSDMDEDEDEEDYEDSDMDEDEDEDGAGAGAGEAAAPKRPGQAGDWVAQAKAIVGLLEDKHPTVFRTMASAMDDAGFLPVHRMAQHLVEFSRRLNWAPGAATATISHTIYDSCHELFSGLLKATPDLASIAVGQKALFRSAAKLCAHLRELLADPRRAAELRVDDAGVRKWRLLPWTAGEYAGYNLLHFAAAIASPGHALRALTAVTGHLKRACGGAGAVQQAANARSALSRHTPLSLVWDNCRLDQLAFFDVVAFLTNTCSASIAELRPCELDTTIPEAQAIVRAARAARAAGAETAASASGEEGEEGDGSSGPLALANLVRACPAGGDVDDEALQARVGTVIEARFQQLVRQSLEKDPAAFADKLLPTLHWLIKNKPMTHDTALGVLRLGFNPGDVDLENRTGLAFALVQGKIGIASALLPKVNLAALDTPAAQEGVTALHTAIRLAQQPDSAEEATALVSGLLSAGASPDQAMTSPTPPRRAPTATAGPGAAVGRERPLHLAMRLPGAEVASLLLSAGADVHGTDAAGNTALHLAAQLQQAKHLSALLKHGALPNAEDNLGRTPLHWAVIAKARDRRDALVEQDLMLITAGADINVRDGGGRTALHYVFDVAAFEAAEFPQPDLAKAFDPIDDLRRLSAAATIDYGVCDAQLRSALHYAAFRRATASALFLIDRKVDSNMLDSDGNTPLAVALLCAHSDFAITLIRQGVVATGEVHRVKRVRVPEAEDDAPAGAATPASPTPEYREVSRETQSTLHHSIVNEWAGLTFFLIEAGFDIERAVWDSLRCSAYQMFRSLVVPLGARAKALVDPATGFNLLHQLADLPTLHTAWAKEIARTLHRLGVPAAAADAKGQTALHCAAARRHFVLCRLYCDEFGVDPGAKDKEGNTALTCMLRDVPPGQLKAKVYKFLVGKAADHLATDLNGRFSVQRPKTEIEACFGLELLEKLVHRDFDPELSSTAKLTAHLVEEEQERQRRRKSGVHKADDSKPEMANVGSTALIEAVLRGDQRLCHVLLVDGARPDLRDGAGLSPLLHATLRNDAAMAALLLRRGADIHLPDAGASEANCLYHATLRGHGEIVRLLLRFGADPLHASKQGYCAIHLSILAGDAAQTRSLVAALGYRASPLGGAAAPAAPGYAVNDRILCRIGGELAWRCARVVALGPAGDGAVVVTVINQDELGAEAAPGATGGGGDRDRYSEYLVPAALCMRPPALVRKPDLLKGQLQAAAQPSQQKEVAKYAGFEIGLLAAGLVDAAKLKAHRLDEVWEAATSTLAPLDLMELLVGAAGEKVQQAPGPPSNYWTRHERGVPPADWAQVSSQYSDKELGCVPVQVVAAHKNGTYDVQAIGGPLLRGVRRALLLPPSPATGATARASAKKRLAAQAAGAPQRRTLLHVLVRPYAWGSHDEPDLALALLEAGVALDARDASGRLAVDYAVRCSDTYSVLMLHDASPKLRRLTTQAARDILTNEHDTPETELSNKSRWELVNMVGQKTHAAAESAAQLSRQASAALAPLAADELDQDFAAARAVMDAAAEAQATLKPPPVNPACELSGAGIRVLQEDGPPGSFWYDVTLSKADVRRGRYGENSFYRLQVLRDPVQQLFILVNNWGRIGELGKAQQTPYNTKAKCVKEFERLFRSKTGNKWEDRAEFEAKPKKYVLLATLHSEYSEDASDLAPLAAGPGAESTLPSQLRATVAAFVDAKALKSGVIATGLDVRHMPLGRLKHRTLVEAWEQLMLVHQAVEEEEAVRQDTDRPLTDFREAREKVAALTNRFYEIFPTTETHGQPISPFTQETVGPMVEQLRVLKDLHLALKLRVAAAHRQRDVHPIDYCLRALQRSVQLSRIEDAGGRERRFIEQYLANTRGDAHGSVVVNEVYRVHRPDEARRMRDSRWGEVGNRRLLWHGSPTANMVGILTQGLRIAPPQASASGYAFGKGVYLSDSFAKSFAYSRGAQEMSRTRAGSERPRVFVLLCEAVLGKAYTTAQAEYMTKAHDDHHSTHGLGCQEPTELCFADEFGTCAVPLGPMRQATGATASSWRSLETADSLRLNRVANDPATEFPAQVKLGNLQDAELPYGPFANEAQLVAYDAAEPEPTALSMQPTPAEGEEASPTVVRGRLRHRQPVGRTRNQGALAFNEFIVYDEKQVRIRYLVELTSAEWIKNNFNPRTGVLNP